jgi:KUP system potassium uptake protein
LPELALCLTPGQGIARPANAASLSALGLSALGVVFGDIGTSPLYTLKTVLSLTGGAPDAAVTLGVLSLVIWTLIVVTTIKYVSVAMRVDNDGEGGILALMSLLGVKRQHRPIIIAFGLFGAALIYGDGAITPAISVLSALEGLDIDASAAQLALRAQAASSCLGPSQPALCFASPWGRLLCCRGRPGE